MSKTVLAAGHPLPVIAPPHAGGTVTAAVSLWLLLQVFSNGCTAMTGVEAVSNGVTAFREPTVRNAQRTLTVIIGLLIVLLAGIAYLVRAYGIQCDGSGTAGLSKRAFYHHQRGDKSLLKPYIGGQELNDGTRSRFVLDVDGLTKKQMVWFLK